MARDHHLTRCLALYKALLDLSFSHPGEYFSASRLIKETKKRLEEQNVILEENAISSRQIRRYIQTINDAICRVDVERGRNGGYKIDDFNAPLRAIKESDLQILSFAIANCPVAYNVLKKSSSFAFIPKNPIVGLSLLSEDTLFKMDSFLDAIKEDKLVVLNDYHGPKGTYDAWGVPLSILYFKGSYYFILAIKQKGENRYVGHIFSPDKCLSVDTKEGIVPTISERTREAWNDSEAFGIHRESEERKEKTFFVPKNKKSLVDVMFDHKVVFEETDDASMIACTIVYYDERELRKYYDEI